MATYLQKQNFSVVKKWRKKGFSLKRLLEHFFRFSIWITIWFNFAVHQSDLACVCFCFLFSWRQSVRGRIHFWFLSEGFEELRPLLAEGHRRPLEHHRGVGQPRGLADALFRDEAGVGELDLPVVAKARVADKAELLVEGTAAPGRRRVVEGAAGRHQRQSVGVDDPRDPIPRQVGVEGNLVPLDDVLERYRHLVGAVADGDELLAAAGSWGFLEANLGTGIDPEVLRSEFGWGRICKL